jgi:hypothetical protein
MISVFPGLLRLGQLSFAFIIFALLQHQCAILHLPLTKSAAAKSCGAFFVHLNAIRIAKNRIRLETSAAA